MKKLGCVTDDGFGEIDMSTPITIDGIAKSAKLGGGVSRGTRLSRHRQIHFMQTFMAAPFIPCYYSNDNGNGGAGAGAGGFSLQRLFPLLNTQNVFSTLLAQFNLHNFLLSSFKHNEHHTLAHSFKHLLDKSFYSLSFSSELLLTPDDTLLLSLESPCDNSTPPRKKAVFHHKFTNHNFTAEALSPALFVNDSSTLWDLPFSMAFDLSSLPTSNSGASYHFSINHNSNFSPKHFQPHHHPQPPLPPPTLLPGLSIQTAFSYKNTTSIWTSQANKLKMVLPYDIFLSNSHLSLSGIIGTVITASLGDNYVTSQVQNEFDGFKCLRFHRDSTKTALLADMFASASCSAQYGNFQRLAMDLTRFYARLDFPSCSKFLSASTRVAQDLHKSQKPSIEAIQAMCPNATLSLQQQIVGPFSLRVDSGVGVDLKNKGIKVEQPVFAIEYALQVLGSAKAIAWYSPMQKEFMVELRFFET